MLQQGVTNLADKDKLIMTVTMMTIKKLPDMEIMKKMIPKKRMTMTTTTMMTMKNMKGQAKKNQEMKKNNKVLCTTFNKAICFLIDIDYLNFCQSYVMSAATKSKEIHLINDW
jgi:hypothetical protein